MLVSPSFLARGARARAGASLLVLATVGCDANRPSLDPATAAASLNGVGMVLDLPTVALTLGMAGSTLHAVRPTTQGMDTVAAVWHSDDEQVVSVDNAGHLTARSAGSAAVWARAGRDSVSSAVTVSPNGVSTSANAATVTIRPALATVSVGVPQQFSALVQAPVSTAGSTVGTASAPVVVWTSSAPKVAAVSSNGTVVPIAPGIAVITATALGARATSTVVVTSTRMAASKVDVAVMRFDGGNGTVVVSNGVPFPRGLLTESTLNQLHMYVNGVEQPVFTRALGGRWPDGSLRAALVQFSYTIPDARTIPGYVTIGGARTLATPAERPAAPTPVAAALPTSSAYLISTGIAGAVYDPTTTRAATTLIAQYEGDYSRLAANDWTQCGASWSCGRTAGYERPFTLYQAWVRTANPTYWYHASSIVANYIDNYLVPANGQPAPWWSNSESMAVHYWASGDERTRGYLHAMSLSLIYQARPEMGFGLGSTPAQFGDDRMRARVLTALLDARLIDAQATATGNPMGGDLPFYVNYAARHPLSEAIGLVLGTQQASGAFGGTLYVGGQKNYMVGMLLTALIRYYEEVTPDARIEPAVKRAIDYIWTTQWHPESLGLQYCSTDRGVDGDGKEVLPDLNNLVVPSFAWYYNRSGDATYAARVDQMLQGATVNRSWWQASGKSFDQGFYRMFNTLQWRNR